MANEEKVQMIERQLVKYGPALTIEEVAEALGVTSKYAAEMLDDGRLESFSLNPEAKKVHRRVAKGVIVAFMLNTNNQKEIEQ